MTRGQDNAKSLFRNDTLAGFARVTEFSRAAQPRSASSKAAGSDGARSSSSLVSTAPVMSTTSSKTRAWARGLGQNPTAAIGAISGPTTSDLTSCDASAPSTIE
jgi:hypothetical protein